MLMRNPDYQVSAEQAVQSPSSTTPTLMVHSPHDSYSQGHSYSTREMLLGHIVLLLLFVIAVLLRTWAM